MTGAKLPPRDQARDRNFQVPASDVDRNTERRHVARKATFPVLPPDIDERMLELGYELVTEAERLKKLLDGGYPDVPSRRRRRSYQLTEYDPSLLAWARFEYRLRRLRDDRFTEAIADGPGWNILVDLFVQTGFGVRVSATSACIGSLAPSTTALRYIKLLEEEKLIRRVPDPADRRRVYLELTDSGEKLLREYFDRAIACCPLEAIS